jgi:hypothetical protein
LKSQWPHDKGRKFNAAEQAGIYVSERSPDCAQPAWLASRFANWMCHRASHIETTTGAKESLIHLLMFAEVSVPLPAAMFSKSMP